MIDLKLVITLCFKNNNSKASLFVKLNSLSLNHLNVNTYSILKQKVIRQHAWQKILLRFRTRQNALRICVHNECISRWILRFIKLKRLWIWSYNLLSLTKHSYISSSFSYCSCCSSFVVKILIGRINNSSNLFLTRLKRWNINYN